MAYRKYGKNYQVRRHFSLVVRDKSQVHRLESLLDSAFADTVRRFKEGIAGCCSIRNKLDEFLDDSRAGLGRRPVTCRRTLERHRRRKHRFGRSDFCHCRRICEICP